MRLVKNGTNKPVYRCQPCHSKAVKEKYSESRNKAAKKWIENNPEKYKLMRKLRAMKEGALSETTVRSRRSEKDAHNARQSWTMRDDKIVLSGQYAESQLAKMLGRTIRAIGRRKHQLREIKKQEMI